MKVRLIVEFDVMPDKTGAFVKMFKEEFISRSRQEYGCELYELWQDNELPHKMRIVEVWTNQQALDIHLSQQWFQEWLPRKNALQSSPSKKLILHSVEDL